ncbi:MAG: hypothetical protein ACK448_08195 [Bacteroidota bacterium]|jgi:hypothetical protein
MGEVLDLTELSKNLEFLEEVAFQIEKDFSLIAFELKFKPYNSLESMIGEVESAIESVRHTQPNLWMKIVYRVDLTEKQYRFAKGLHGETSANLAKGVILREAQKVYTRKMMK